MNEPPEVSIVLVNYNQLAYTAQCLESLFAAPPQVSFEVVLVDNASHDGSAEELERRFPQVKLVRSPVNRGIAGGNNLGIRAGNSRYVLLLNNDTLVTPGSIDRAAAYLDEHPEVAGVGGDLLNPDRSFQSGYARFHTLGSVFLDITRLGHLIRPEYPSFPPSNEIREVEWMSTAFMLFRRQALEEVGLVDEEYFIYSDETDLEYRLYKNGWKIVYLPELQTIHFGGKSLTPWRRRWLMYRGTMIFFRKHHSRLALGCLRGMFVLASGLKLPVWALLSCIPSFRQRAREELKSHFAILRMALTLDTTLPPRA